MATIVLSAVGASLAGSLGGSVLGMSAAMIGRAAGATLGMAIDQRLMGSGSEVIESGRIDRFRLTGASEGTAVPEVFGAVRVPGQIIWASDFLERRSTSRSGGGKGGPKAPTVRSYSYSVSLAVAVCEGEISHVARIWADGTEISRESFNIRVYNGSDAQLPDPKIAAIEGSENAPAYRGTAYVVFEDLGLSRFGNRVPQFSFEVVRPERDEFNLDAPSVREGMQAVALIPGTGEYSLATTAIHYADGPGANTTANVHNSLGKTDFEASMDALDIEAPNCESISLVVSWFGDDLRCANCEIRPKVEHKDAEGYPMSWKVAGLDRLSADRVPTAGGRPIYGGTPTDKSVIQAIREMRGRGKAVMFYPFILMEQPDGNNLPNPWTGENGQPPLPWRGRITTSRAPGVPGSPDGTAQAASEVSDFLGTAKASDFDISGGGVSYDGPNEWSLRRFILHYAALCAAAGGVDSFCIGSEMRALTQIRGNGNSFPAVDGFIDLASEVRALLGPGTKIGYAADWSEYFGYTPGDNSGDHFFHLDPLWASPEIDFIGIDNYMPLSDWRDGEGHADAGWDSIYDLNYLKANVAGGEGYDWYYPDDDAVANQTRVPITDGAYNEPWVFRYKDLVNWWSRPHHDRVGGVRQPQATDWVPQSKPIWFTELGCAAIDKGTNQPNKFLDPKSSESKLPRASTGARDDLIQMQYLRAMYAYWGEEENNPVSQQYGGSMVDMSRAHVWAWDARPHPWFPGLPDIWSDGDNYTRGHWLNGRMGSRLLSSVVSEIVQKSGVEHFDVSRLHGLVRGYSIDEPSDARRALEPLMLAYGFEAVERNGRIEFRSRSGKSDAVVDRDLIAMHPEKDGDFTMTRAAETELAGSVRVIHIDADGNYEPSSVEAIYPGAEKLAVSQSELNLVLTRGEARAIAERWLSESRVSRDSVQFSLPPSQLAVGAGDVVSIPDAFGSAHYRIDRAEQAGAMLIEAVRVETGLYGSGKPIEEQPRLASTPALLPPTPLLLDLPLLTGDEVPHAPYIAVAANPWPGEIAVWSSPSDSDYRLNTLVEAPSILGVTQSPLSRARPGLLDRGPALRVRITGGALSSVPGDALLNGANVAAIGDGTAANWEIFQFERAELVGADTYDLSLRLRGQLGTDALIPDVWPEGSWVVVLDGSPSQIDMPSTARGLERTYRIGPAESAYDHPSYVQVQATAEGVGLRPYAPSHLRSRTEANGDHVLSWIRRTRIDGDLWSNGEVPLGEDRESYAVEVRFQGSVVRRDAIEQPTWIYSTADRQSDGVNGGYEFAVAQVSDRFGPGPYKRIVSND